MDKKTIQKQQLAKTALIIIGFIILLLIFGLFDPNQYDFYLKCPFFEMSGYKCPLCGSQRAIHNLINLNIKNALYENALLFILLPYLIIIVLLSFYRKSNKGVKNLYQLLINKIAKTIVIVLAILFWIIRNIA